MGKLIDVKAAPIQETIETLLQDKTTGKNIIWASNCYAEEGFGFRDVDNTWTVNHNKIPFRGKNDWQSYVCANSLEITCGEGPFVVSRYDAASGELINPLINRIGILDRKLRVVNENTETNEEWLK